MWVYIVRRVLYAIPVLVGINLITFLLFFVVNTPDHIAKINLGHKYITQDQLNLWKQQHGYHLPLLYDTDNHSFTNTIFWQKSIALFKFEFGLGDNGRDIKQAIKERYIPSLSIAIPSLAIGLALNIIIALTLTLFRFTYLDTLGMIACVILISISGLFYIICAQFIVSKLMRLTPISGYADGFSSFKFILLPVLVSVFSGIGSGVRWYKGFFNEEMDQDYVRTARAKGLSPLAVLFKHVLPNALLPILTGVVAVLPLLFLGSLILESFFAIPGLGSYTIDAIYTQDFAVVRSMVFLGSVLYILGLLLTDISYTLVDPRVKLH